MIATILLGIDLFLAIVSLLFIGLSIISDMVNSNNPVAFTKKNMEEELAGHAGARWVAAFVTSVCWTIFIMCVI